MRRRVIPSALPALCLLAAAWLVGCRSTPKPASEVVVVPRTETPTPAHDPLSAIVPVGYWRESGNASPSKVLGQGRRVVITQFDVELVDLQSQSPFGPQMAVKPPPVPVGPLSLFGLGVGMELSGLGRKHVQLSEDQHHALAGCLLIEMENDLRRHGLVVLPRQSLATSAGYAALETEPTAATSPWMLLNPVGSDTGIVMHARTVPAPGFAVATDQQTTDSTVAARILRETGAGVALAVKLRVGVFRKKAALEEGSVLCLDTLDGQVVLKARRSILSDAEVVGKSGFRPLVGETEPVLPEKFAQQLSAILPKFLELAFR